MKDTRTKEQKRLADLEKWNSRDDLSKCMPVRVSLNERKESARSWAIICKNTPSMSKLRPPLTEEEIENMTEEDNERIYQNFYQKYLIKTGKMKS